MVGGKRDQTAACFSSWPPVPPFLQQSITRHDRLSSQVANDVHWVGLIIELWSRYVSSIALPRLYVRLDKPVPNGQNSQGNRESNVYPEVLCNFDI